MVFIWVSMIVSFIRILIRLKLLLAGSLAMLLWPAVIVCHAVEPKEFTLSNDMKVLLVEVPKAPVATVQVWYKVGSRNEMMGRAGLSHMLEHMMFKGTSRYPKGTFSRLVRKN
jgi:zinc protease